LNETRQKTDTRDPRPGFVLALGSENSAVRTWQQLPPVDIIDAAEGLRLGGNWYALESQDGQPFRWVDNNAEIIVNTKSGQSEMLEFEVEGGPSYGGRSAPLRVVGQDGRILATAEILHRRTVRIELPAGSQGQPLLRLQTDGGKVSIPNDMRMLNFRIFRIRQSKN
jgi:hypothetical protein